MKKLMEVYAVDNGLIISRPYKVYHLFCGVEQGEEKESVKIGDRVDAIKFMLDFFDGLGLEERTIYSNDTIETVTAINLKLK